MSVHSWIKHREVGSSSNAFFNNNAFIAADVLLLKRKLWSKLHLKYNDDKQNSNFCRGCKGVFDLKYSENGKLLVAACEGNSVVVIDPLTSKDICRKDNVHTKRCNTITFIDDRMFATCSDDSNVSVWDIRNMKESVWLLKGHNGWVKNVEYHKPTGLLLSSGFDNQVLAWNINSSVPEAGCTSKLLLECSNLTRMRLSRDGSSMYISTLQTADLIAIHNLDIDHLLDDVGDIYAIGGHEYRCIVYQDQQLPYGRGYPHDSFWRPITRRNHVELYYGYYDVDADADTNIICSSLDVHPENLAIVMKYDWHPSLGTKCVSVHNTWSYYNGRFQGNNFYDIDKLEKSRSFPSNFHEAYLPLLRGQPTNYVCDDAMECTNYIQEVVFSNCGRLIAAPAGYGVRILAYDEKISDYRSEIASRVSSTHVYESGDIVLPEYATLPPNHLHTVAFCFGHCSLVLSTCFSPTHMQVASGSRAGEIILHEVIL